ncbi:MAG: fumarylacetoacetate hydrolase [Cytophagales bacterium]|nr:fumarylacetoacetate hydrolase [Rhizobacter sp.]
MMVLRSVLATVLLVSVSLSQAECLTDAQAVALFDAFVSKTPAANPEGLSEADGACTRAKLNGLLALRYGTVIGYKAGLTNPAVQKRFNYDRPVWGVLYEGMLLNNGAVVEAGFGARPLYEADLLVRVKSEAINQAKTPADVLAAIDQIFPFFELPDRMVQVPPKLNGPAVNAINVGARMGVMGQPIAMPPYRAERFALLDALRDMTVILSDGTGAELARGKGSDILGHPLNAVVWLAEALAQEGRAMKPGDLISLGSFSPLLPPKAGTGAAVTYVGLPGATPVLVTFK